MDRGNVIDYNAIVHAKDNANKKFELMLTNLTNMKTRIDEMNAESWQGSSANVFNEVFEEIKGKIDAERQEFNKAIDERLAIWHNQFSDEEKAQVQAAQAM